MSKKSSNKGKQSTLSGFIKVGDTKRRKMDDGPTAETSGGAPANPAEKVIIPWVFLDISL